MGEFIFSINFLVLNTKKISNVGSYIPVILERLFLATLNALINHRNDTINYLFCNMTLDLNIFNLRR